MPAGILPGKAAGGRFANAVDEHENHADCIFPVLIGISVGNVRQPRSRCSSCPQAGRHWLAISAEIAIPLGERTCPAGATTAGLRPVVSKCALSGF